MVLQNLNIVKEKVSERCSAAGRNPEDISIIAVSKNTGLALINEAIDAGQIDFGENKAQELNEKAKLLNEKNIRWHFLGHLQTNKVKYVVGAAELIHSVDSAKVADEINKQSAKLGKIQKVLIEVKTSYEPEKYGINTLDDLISLAEYCRNLSNIELKGLMTMAPFTDDEVVIRKSFSDLRKYKENLIEKGFQLSELSMGMTGDYDIAIEEGATILRIGTAIFGERDYSKDWKEQ